MINDNGLTELLLSAVMDKIEQNEIDRLRDEFQTLQREAARARREQKNADIMQLAGLKTELARFKYTYNNIVKKTGETIPALESYIRDVNNMIVRISFNKNH